jgi:hypothetical protein
VERVPLFGLDPPGDGNPLCVFGRPSRRPRRNAGQDPSIGDPLVLFRGDLFRLVPREGVRGEVRVGELAEGGADFAVRIVVVGRGPVLVPLRVTERNEVCYVGLVG